MSRVPSPLSLLIDDPRMDHLITIDVPIPQVQTISRDQMSPEGRTTEEMVAQTNKLNEIGSSPQLLPDPRHKKKSSLQLDHLIEEGIKKVTSSLKKAGLSII